VTGFILAAGFGTRLRPLTEYVPKALVPVCGAPILEHQVHRLEKAGISRLGANVHYLPEQMEAFGKTSTVPLRLFHETGEIRGTGGALDFAREFLAQDEAFCVCNVDILSSIDLAVAVTRFLDSGAACTLVAAPPEGGGTVVYDAANGRYAGTPHDCRTVVDRATADYIGLALYRRCFLDTVTEDDFSIVPVWRRAVEEGLDVSVMVVPGLVWYDIGTPRAFAHIHFDVMAGRFALPLPSDMVVDRDRRSAWRREMAPEKAAPVGPDTWVESLDIDPGARLERTVVLRDASIGADHITDAIVTRWGQTAVN
jgi:mannose-1-phosphate guanylyltransferase